MKFNLKFLIFLEAIVLLVGVIVNLIHWLVFGAYSIESVFFVMAAVGLSCIGIFILDPVIEWWFSD